MAESENLTATEVRAVQMAREIAGLVRDAILAERERCANLAESYNLPGLSEKLGVPSDIINSTALEIAVAIRQDNPINILPGQKPEDFRGG